MVQETIKIVKKINEKFIDDDMYSEYSLSVTTNGYCCFVTFLGIDIWSSEDDERKFIDDENRYEDLSLFLERQIQKKINDILSIYRKQEQNFVLVYDKGQI